MIGGDFAVAGGGTGGIRCGFGNGAAGLVSPAGSPIGLRQVGRVIAVTVRRRGLARRVAGRIAVGGRTTVGQIICIICIIGIIGSLAGGGFRGRRCPRLVAGLHHGGYGARFPCGKRGGSAKKIPEDA
jgi:hypothetical protein